METLGPCFARNWKPTCRWANLKRMCAVEEMAKTGNDRSGLLWTELPKKAKSDPEPAKYFEAAERVIETYSETLQRLSDSRYAGPLPYPVSTAAPQPLPSVISHARCKINKAEPVLLAHRASSCVRM